MMTIQVQTGRTLEFGDGGRRLPQTLSTGLWSCGTDRHGEGERLSPAVHETAKKDRQASRVLQRVIDGNVRSGRSAMSLTVKAFWREVTNLAECTVGSNPTSDLAGR